MARTTEIKPAILTPEEASSPVWLKVKSYLDERLAMLREKNDSALLDDRETARLRGRIAEVKNLAALDQPAPQVEADDAFKD